eukprot:TRINITY_DN24536_c0_g1_i1.p1 TRINITY_DN24536_c0_g1~~TRINITY_DN24536_c0_g1_i1.p1  ORF type:complete len:204 (-),score=37.12 TRINITY_DN24536_c0_g1_i1:37-648(-)
MWADICISITIIKAFMEKLQEPPSTSLNAEGSEEVLPEKGHGHALSLHSDAYEREDVELLSAVQGSAQRSASSPHKSSQTELETAVQELEETKELKLESTQRRIYKPQSIPSHIIENPDNFPKTGLFLPFELPFTNPSNMMSELPLEELGPTTPVSAIEELQKKEAERVGAAEDNNKLVYDLYEASPYPVSYTHLTLPTICSV